MNHTQDLIMNMASCVCDHICQKPKEITDKEKLEEYCNEVCDFPARIYRAMNMAERENFVPCSDCKYRAREKKRQIQPGAVSQKDWTEIWKKKTDVAEEERCPTRTPKNRGCN